MNLTEFLLARIAEDEGPRRWWQRRSERRKAVELFSRRPIPRRYQPYITPASALHALKLLAEPYADHPDYRAEWRP